MPLLNLALLVFGALSLVLFVFSGWLSRVGLPAPLVALAVGVGIGPFAVGLVRPSDFGGHSALEQVARITVAVGLVGVAQRLPSGYWRRHWRWVLASIGFGMPIALIVASGLVWWLLGVPLLIAVLVGAILSPTDPIVTTPIVTGGFARKHVAESVREDLSSESGINDGFGYPFVFAPILLLTKPTGDAWRELFTSTVLIEVLGAIVLGLGVGWLVSFLFRFGLRHSLIDESSRLGFFLPFGLAVLGALKLIGTDGVLAVFVAAAVFGQRVSNEAEEQQSNLDDVVSRFFIVPVFLMLGVSLPFGEWARLGVGAAAVLTAAVLLRRIVAIWSVRPVFGDRHDTAQTAFMSWFGPVGVSALYYALLAERLTGAGSVFAMVTIAITASVVIHGISSAPFSRWLARRSPPT